MNRSEHLAKLFLSDLGWEPKKINSSFEKYMPDFRCSKNRYVEIKKESATEIHFGVNQLRKIRELIERNNDVFFMVYSHDCNTFDMFKIDYYMTGGL